MEDRIIIEVHEAIHEEDDDLSIHDIKEIIKEEFHDSGLDERFYMSIEIDYK